MPSSLTSIAIVALGLAVACALLIIADLALGQKQRMWVMNVVWPITALWAGPFGLLAYFKYGRASAEQTVQRAKQAGQTPPHESQPFEVQAGKAATHCGAGCTLGDLVAEFLALAVPLRLFGKPIFGTWVYDYILALLFGIAFQYFTIKPMKGLSPADGLKAAFKADFFSLTAWQLGMYGWMALATFVLFHHELSQTDPIFWLMMQLAMLAGFATSYPVNWWLLRRGVKEKM